jgi:uncharacterized Tic20 family protein
MDFNSPNPSSKPTPTSDERVWAGLAHGSILLFGFGAIAALVIWITQRKKSTYVAFQSLQALLYQALRPVVMMLVGLVIAILYIILAIIAITLLRRSGTDSSFPVYMVIFELAPLLITIGLGALYFLGGMIAAACHLGAFTNLWGMALPLVAWLSEKNRSAVLRCQAMQALVYQGIGLAAGILLAVGVFAGQFMVMLAVAFGSLTADQNTNSWMIIFILLLGLLLLIIFAAALLLGPLYQTFALVAAWQVSHDKDYHYPLLGKLIANRQKPLPAAPVPTGDVTV